MEDTELRELFHGVIVRMERFEGRLEALEKAFTDFRTETRGRLDTVERRMEGLENRVSGQVGALENRLSAHLEGLEHRLADKASNLVVSLWGGTLAILIGVATAILKLT